MKHAIVLTVMLAAAGCLALAGAVSADGAPAGELPGLSAGVRSAPAPAVYTPGTTLTCIADDVSLREGPATNARRLGSLRRGERVTFLEAGTNEILLGLGVRGGHGGEVQASAPWYRVRTPRGVSGWAWGAYLFPRWYPEVPVLERSLTNVTDLYPLGWSRDGKFACWNSWGEGHGLYIFDARAGRMFGRTGFWDRWCLPDVKPYRTWAAWWWDVEKIRIHRALNAAGIEPGSARSGRPLVARQSRDGVAFEVRRLGDVRWLVKTSPGMRRWVPFPRDLNPDWPPHLFESPFNGDIALFVSPSRPDMLGERFVRGPADTRRVVRVRTAQELFTAIAPDTEIRLAPGRYLLNRVFAGTNRWATAGPRGLVVRGVGGLALVGEGKAELVADAWDAVPLAFEGCHGLALRTLSAGHVDIRAGATCTAGVLDVAGSLEVSLERVALWGCGDWGLRLGNVRDFRAVGLAVTNCATWGLHLTGATDAAFRDCLFAGNAGAAVVYADGCRDVRFAGCRLERNVLGRWSPLVDGFRTTNMVFDGCQVTGNTWLRPLSEGVGDVRFERCVFGRNVIHNNE